MVESIRQAEFWRNPRKSPSPKYGLSDAELQTLVALAVVDMEETLRLWCREKKALKKSGLTGSSHRRVRLGIEKDPIRGFFRVCISETSTRSRLSPTLPEKLHQKPICTESIPSSFIFSYQGKPLYMNKECLSSGGRVKCPSQIPAPRGKSAKKGVGIMRLRGGE